MTTSAPQLPATQQSDLGRSWTIRAFLSLLTYLVWLPLMFAFGYLLGSLFGYEPGTNEDVGFWALSVNVLVAVLVIPLPSWIGAGLALRARHCGGGIPAVAALVLCLVTGLGLLVMSLPLHGV